VYRSGDATIYKCNFAEHDSITLESSAILFMDVWAEAPIEYWKANSRERLQKNWLERWNEEITPHMYAKVLPLLEFARENNIEVIFADGRC